MKNPSRPPWISIAYLAWGIWLAVWTVGLLRPEPIAVRDAVVPNAWAYWVSKIMHVLGYAALVSWPAFRWRAHWFWIGLGGVAHGAATEALQPFFGRNGTLTDVGWDVLGLLLGLIPTLWAIRRKRQDSENRSRA